MLPKQAAGQCRLADKLEGWAEFRDDRTVVALTLGRRLERALRYDAAASLAEHLRGGADGARRGSMVSVVFFLPKVTLVTQDNPPPPRPGNANDRAGRGWP
ncbi:unnamed protein product [Prorocentrum cordatum]|uniref:Uncharacterized protein n=1 Tax=Prorocentrum cordatum TaxID=2364126 RepID=A0ABN9PNW4_9DINO|nr:unnamed protein product [Polarella glacialis]